MDAIPRNMGEEQSTVNRTLSRIPHDNGEDAAPSDQDEPRSAQHANAEAYPYVMTADGIFLWKKTKKKGEPQLIQLTNFQARVVREVITDDGLECLRVFEIEVKLAGRSIRFSIPADRFQGMTWILEVLGAGAILHPVHNANAHLRTAIQMFSDAEQRIEYKHLGWRQIGEDGAWVFLHGDGAIGEHGQRGDVCVTLPQPLAGFTLPPTPTQDEDLHTAIQASLGLLDLGPATLMFPLLAAIYRAPLGNCCMSIHLEGRTGTFKSELAALCQQHFGPNLDARRLPAAWSSTENYLEDLAYLSKDVVLVVDDFVSAGGSEKTRLHAKAERVLRATGNRSGRGRLRRDGTPLPARPPQCLILSTGEDTPQGHSLRARCLIIEVKPIDVDQRTLTELQMAASQGYFAEAMAAFVQRLAPRLEEKRDEVACCREVYRELAYCSGQHRRTPDLIADLMAGLCMFFEFAAEKGAIDLQTKERLVMEGWDALLHAGKLQSQQLQAEDPAEQFLGLIRSVLMSGQAHVKVISCGASWPPGLPRKSASALSGKSIGWVEGEDLYLESRAAFAEAQRMARDNDAPIPIGREALHRRLDEKGLLKTIENRGKERRLTIRKTIEGARVPVLHFAVSSLFPADADHPDQDLEDLDSSEAVDGPANGLPHTTAARRPDQATPLPDASSVPSGPPGPDMSASASSVIAPKTGLKHPWEGSVST